MVQEVGDQGSFGANLKGLHDKGLISERDREALEKIIEAGHAAMHRQYVPDTEDLKTLLDVTEALLATVYVHPKRSAELKKRIPPRK